VAQHDQRFVVGALFAYQAIVFLIESVGVTFDVFDRVILLSVVEI
jgi:hypothetical protein